MHAIPKKLRQSNELKDLRGKKSYQFQYFLSSLEVCYLFEQLLKIGYNGVILVIIIALVVIYCFQKRIPIVNQIFLGVSHVFLPYLMIKIDSGLTPHD